MKKVLLQTNILSHQPGWQTAAYLAMPYSNCDYFIIEIYGVWRSKPLLTNRTWIRMRVSK